jgi:hypothetical protein
LASREALEAALAKIPDFGQEDHSKDETNKIGAILP